MVELFLLQHDQVGFYTDFWGDAQFRWPVDVVGDSRELPPASPASLAAYRAANEGPGSMSTMIVRTMRTSSPRRIACPNRHPSLQ